MCRLTVTNDGGNAVKSFCTGSTIGARSIILGVAAGVAFSVAAGEVPRAMSTTASAGAQVVADSDDAQFAGRGDAETLRAVRSLGSNAMLRVLDGTGGRFVAIPPADVRVADTEPRIQLAQFGRGPGPGVDFTVPELPQRIPFQYGYGSESPIRYRANSDLDQRVRDNLLVLLPNLNAYVVYRPVDWIELLLEVAAEWDYAALEQTTVTLPGGNTKHASKRYATIFVDQAFVRLKDIGGPFEFIVGRRNIEDERRWLYDLSMDGVTARLKVDDFHFDFTAAQPDLVNLQLRKPLNATHINYYIAYLEYRGIEDTRLAAYAIRRQDPYAAEGRPVNFGLRAIGFITPELSYWGELGFLRGRDEISRRYSGYAFDVGATYRFPEVALTPNVTLGYAYATGNAGAEGSTNNLFHQTGLESNEWRFGGISRFKVYGEALNPALSNLGILTMGLGFRPAGNVSIDLVYHHYRLSELNDSIPASAITAQMNGQSKDVGSGLDVVLGVRGLFGVRRLGVDLRAGWFFPGSAFHFGGDASKDHEFRKPDPAMAITAKFWW